MKNYYCKKCRTPVYENIEFDSWSPDGGYLDYSSYTGKCNNCDKIVEVDGPYIAIPAIKK